MSKLNKFIDFTADSKMLLTSIHPDAAEFMSKVFANLAEELHYLASQKQQARLEKVAQITSRRHVDVLVAMMIDAGKSQHHAISELQSYGVSSDQVRYLWRHIKPRVERVQLKAKRATALRLKRKNYSNQEIATVLECSVRTVQRYLS